MQIKLFFRTRPKKNLSSVLRCVAVAFFMLVQISMIHAQQEITVTGTVMEKGESLPGANVTIKGTSKGIMTDVDGKFTIVVPNGNAVLVFSFVGYQTQEFMVGNQTRIDVELREDTRQIEEIVVIGYAENSRAKVISAVSSVKNEEMKNIPSVNAAQALQGKVAGVVVPISTGQPGSSPRIVIRGGTSLNPLNDGSSNPLFIVDGVFRNFNDLNADDIESIQFMKDAASTAIYGARGSNGVVVVKTKTGKKSAKANVNFRYQHGWDTQARKYDYLSAREYIVVAREAMMRGLDNFNVDNYLYVTGGNSATVPTFRNPGDYGRFRFTPAYMDNLVEVEGQTYVDNLLRNGWETIADPANPDRTIIFKDSHYQDVLWNTAHVNNYNVSVDGGSDAANYNVSVGYVDQDGVYLGTGYKRFSSLANAGYKVSDKLRVDVNFSYLWNDNKYSDNEERDLIRGARVPPLNRLYNDDGTPNLGESLNPRNRLHQLYYQDESVNTATTIGRIGADYEIIKNLHFRPSASIKNELFSRMYFERYFPEQTNPRDKYQRMQKSMQIMADAILQYNKDIKHHHFMILGGFNYTQNTSFDLIATSQRSATDYISTISGDPQSTIINDVVTPNFTASSTFSQTKSSSLFGQLSYDYYDKYLFGASLRRDGFSNFAPENRYALFPSVSAGWNIHKEEFWDVAIMDMLKLRASYGSTGLSNLSVNDTYGVYGASRYATYSGILRSNIPNSKLLWETTNTWDAGFDLAFFSYRLKFSFDVYNKLTNDRLADYPLAAETGFSSIKYNVGSIRNRGIEIDIDANIIQTKDFIWNSHFTFAYNNQMVVSLPDNGKDKNRINGGTVYDPKTGKDIEVGGYAEGERPLGLWAWKSEGIFATDEEAAAWDVHDQMVPAAMLGSTKHGGDVKWADLNGDKIIDGKDLVFMGYRTPDKVGGWQNTLSYKGISLRFTIDYAMGHVISNGALGRSLGQGRSSNEGAPREAIGNDIWQKQGDSGKKYPRFSFADFDIGQRNHLRMVSNILGLTDVGNGYMYGLDNSIYYCKGDFIAFRELSVSYRLPKSIISKFHMSNLTLNAGVYNIGYITAYTGLNPEVYEGYDPGRYPRPRQFTLGASLTF